MSIDMDMNILAVDDSGTMRVMFRQYLEKAGFTKISLAVNGVDALKKLEAEGPFDLIISDWNMPTMDGLELLQEVRKREALKKIPFIMATAQGDKTQQEIARNAGSNGHVPKPFDEVELKTAIEKAFAPTEEATSAEKHTPEVRDGKVVIRLGHIQITDHLALGILKHWIDKGEVSPERFILETDRLPGWNPVQEKLENGEVSGAMVLAPIAMDLFAYNVPIRLVLFAHKNGSGFVRSSRYEEGPFSDKADFYKYKVVNIPHKMSIHNMLAHQYLTGLGLKPGVPGQKAINVRFEVVPPVKMPPIMKEDDSVGGFIVAEPICTRAASSGLGSMEFVSGGMWPDHPCCVVALRQELIESAPEAVQELTDLLVKAGRFVSENKKGAAEIALSFLDPEGKMGLSLPVLLQVLGQKNGITMDDLYPSVEDLDKIQNYMYHDMGIGKLIDLNKFVDLRFADKATGRGDAASGAA
ncbi:ABC transporter substrate-binding protein [Desulfoluna spongiiphila]|uniref:ABC-type nitrate/sulfonate/bicarbonate transport system, substrate-binding protein n=1 Tax=Desulfoluna spongiiphila TaxID=419481 RepID=A0A1G5HBK9_9BACT|nr:ABC transporter substrate-binding protein [Desulfoluna spongiiphila]SCY61107.1 ABC-type nitrate/sulfonate/bicarbonate transport system, substrate-binding protein [Desulfoluna spongiiphila]VVS94603.1 signal transduction response regulator receiver domain [Desulfoluna spongiiphila]